MPNQLFSALLFLLFCLPSNAKVIVSSSLLETKIPIFGTLFQPLQDYGPLMKMPEPGANVVWGTFEKQQQQVVFLEIFSPRCSQNITLYAAAYNNFSVYLNDHFVLKGDQKGFTYQVNINVQKCKAYVLQFRVHNSQNPKQGLIYQIHQNQTCTNCPTGSFFHDCTCSCQCNVKCDCQYPKTRWFQYPTCACGCPSCKQNQILDKQTCQCQCFPGDEGCPPEKFWNLNKCECQCENKTCPPNMEVDKENCQCSCKKAVCPFGFNFNEEKCQCQCSRGCPGGFTLSESCLCICEKSQDCGAGASFDALECRCMPDQ